MKRQSTDWKKILANQKSDEGLISGIKDCQTQDYFLNLILHSQNNLSIIHKHKLMSCALFKNKYMC